MIVGAAADPVVGLVRPGGPALAVAPDEFGEPGRVAFPVAVGKRLPEIPEQEVVGPLVGRLLQLEYRETDDDIDALDVRGQVDFL